MSTEEARAFLSKISWSEMEHTDLPKVMEAYASTKIADLRANLADAVEDNSRYSKCFERIAKAIGIESPMQITAAAENNEENTAEILTRLVERFAAENQQLPQLRKEVETLMVQLRSMGGVCFHPLVYRQGISPVDRSERCGLCGTAMSDPMRKDK